MPGGGHHHTQPLGRAAEYKGRTTSYVILACLVAASGGLIFGYDIGVSGGVTSMDDFLDKFFPVVERNRHKRTKDQDYCQYDNQGLTAFTSSLYIAGLITSLLVASKFTGKYGRKPSIILGGICYLIGSILNGAAVNLAMLIIGRIMLGIAVGFGNQSVPLYLSEMAPARIRGALNQLFQLAVTIGILCANVINYGTEKARPWGWRLSLALAAVPALLMITGGLFLPETPNSLIERGHYEQGRRILVKIRGTEEVDAEYSDIVDASEKSKAIVSPFKNILAKRSRPQLTMAILLPIFQQLTGINAIMFYAPVLFKTIGFGSSASLYSAVITGVINMISTFVSIATVDRVGRRALFLEGGIQMFFSQIVVAIILALKFGGDKELSKGYAVFTVIVVCVYVAGFAWSWGPLAWLVPSEIFPLETRSAGQAITVSVNLLFTFIIAQAFLAMLCHLKYGIFLLFAAFVLVMSVFIYNFLPETKGVPIEEMYGVWRRHWFWKKFLHTEDAAPLPQKNGALEMQQH